MDRYGQFYGCDETGRYMALRTSPGIMEFFSRNGANSPSTACQEITKTLSRFERFPNYFKNSPDEYPVSVCYAPMHLDKTSEIFASMKPLYAIAINGGENRIRDTSYACCAIMSREEILGSSQYTYLDHIFGTPLVSWMDMYELRENRVEQDCSMKPSKVDVDIRKKDLKVVLAIVKAIYNGGSVVIRLEKNRNFNRRSMDLLAQAYALMPPRLAVEIGFATYQTESASKILRESAGTRIFVIPSEAEFPNLGENVILMDLNDPSKITIDENDDVVRTAKWWSKRSCSQRYEALKLLFADPAIRFMDAEKYVEISTTFSQQVVRIVKPESGVVHNLAELKALYDSYSAGTMAIQWVRDEFRKNIPVVLEKGLTLNQLKDEAAACVVIARKTGDKEAQKKWTELFSFAYAMESGDTAKESRNREFQAFDKGAGMIVDYETRALNEQMDKLGEIHKAELAAKDEVHRKELVEKDSAHQKELEIKEESCSIRIAVAAEELRKAKEDGEKALKAEKAAHEADNAKHEQVLQDSKDQAEKTLADQKTKYEDEKRQLIADHADELATEQVKTKKAEEALADAQSSVQDLNTKLNTAKADLTIAKTSLADAVAKRDEMEGKLNKTASDLRASQAEASGLKRSITSLERDRDDAVAAANAERDSAVEKAASQDKRLRELEQTVKTGRNMKELIICAAAGLLAGALLMGIIWAVVGAVTGGKEETIPTTVPVETTLPVETTVPTEPIETTVPPTEPTEPVLDEINWNQVLYYSGMTAVEENANRAENLLGEYLLDEDAEVLAVVTSEEDGFGTYGTVLPESFAVLMLKDEDAEEPIEIIAEETTEPAETEDGTGKSTKPSETEDGTEKSTKPSESKDGTKKTTEPTTVETATLSSAASMILEGEHYRLIVVGDGDIQQAALKLFALVNPEQDVDVALSVTMADGSVLELGELMAETLETEPWWIGVQKISFKSVDLQYGQAVLGSSRTPVAAVFCGEGTVFVYDYSDDAKKGAEMLTLQQRKNRNAAEIEGLVAICYTK